jgi:hypothetical protein
MENKSTRREGTRTQRVEVGLPRDHGGDHAEPELTPDASPAQALARPK